MQLVKKIDIHGHTKKTKGIPRLPSGQFASPAELCEMYDILGIEKSVLLPVVTPDGGYELSTNEEIAEIVAERPDRFAWFCNIDPRMGGNSGSTDFTYFLNYYKALGAKGVGEVTANLPFDDPRMLALFDACGRCGMPVLFHIGGASGDYGAMDELGLPRLEKLLQMFPDTRFLGHSQKFWSEIGGGLTEAERWGYPTGPVAPGGRVVQLMRRYPNLCGDLSAGSGYNAVTRDAAFGYAFLEEFCDRLYFGTDICDPANISNPMVRLAAYLDEAVTNGKISYDAYYKISRGNAEKLLADEIQK